MLAGRKVKDQVELLLASAARTATGQTIGSGLPAQFDDLILVLDVTAISGAAATLVVVYQISPDGGTTWVDHTLMAASVGVETVLKSIPGPIGSHFRIDYRISGTTPSVTFSLRGIFSVRG